MTRPFGPGSAVAAVEAQSGIGCEGEQCSDAGSRRNPPSAGRSQTGTLSRFETGRRGVSPWMPRIDVFDRENDLVVKVEVPGVAPEDVDGESRIDEKQRPFPSVVVFRGRRHSEPPHRT